MASRSLRTLLNGHMFSCEFMACQKSLTALRAAARAGFQWAGGTGAWIHRVDVTLQSWGWTNIAPWQWQHLQEGSFNLQNDHWQLILHQLRESWRRFCWDSFCHQTRRDSMQFAQEPFSSLRCKEACRLFQRTSQHGRAVLTGAALSLACYQVMYEKAVAPGCSFCGNADVYPGWDHLVWQCSGFSTGRPPEPQDEVQRRLAWPPDTNDQDYNERVLHHMACVREKVWSYAPSSRGRKRSA